MRRSLTLALALVAAGTLSAEQPAQTKATTTTEPAPTVIETTPIQETDSPLVQAAKRARAARQNSKDRIKITSSSTSGKGRVFQSTGPERVNFNLPNSSAQTPPPAPPESQLEMEKRVALEKKRIELKKELARMLAESEGPTGDEVDEDYVEKRLREIPKEIEELERQRTEKPPAD